MRESSRPLAREREQGLEVAVAPVGEVAPLSSGREDPLELELVELERQLGLEGEAGPLSGDPLRSHWQSYPLLRRRSRRLRWSGKRSVADAIRREARVERYRLGVRNPAEGRRKAIYLLRPTVELRSFKKGGQTIQRPIAVLPHRQLGQARKLVRRRAAKEAEKSKRSFAQARGARLVSSLSNKGVAIHARNEHHKAVLSNRGSLRRSGGRRRRVTDTSETKARQQERRRRWEAVRAERAVEPWEPEQLAEVAPQEEDLLLVQGVDPEAASAVAGTPAVPAGGITGTRWWRGAAGRRASLPREEQLRALTKTWWVGTGRVYDRETEEVRVGVRGTGRGATPGRR